MSATSLSTQDATHRFIDRARDLAPGIRSRIAETERLRGLPPESVSELVEAGFARAYVPARYGGLELGWDAGFDAIREIGKADASHAWCCGVMLVFSQFSGYLPVETQDELWSSSPDVPLGGSILPICDVKADGDGFRVSGRSPFASGINHAEWAYVAGFAPSPAGPQWTFFLLERSQFEVEDTWQMVGMRGTGSNTIITEDAYVPAARALSMADLREGTGPGSAEQDSGLYRLPWVSFAPLSFVTPMLGAAQGAYEQLRDWTRSRVTKNGSAMADLPTVQLKMAHAAADLDAAELLLRRVVAETLKPEPPSLELRARAMRDIARCGQMITASADAVLALAGSAGFAESNDIQHHWRDVHFASTHISMNDSSPLHWARTELGLGPAPKQAQY